MGFKDGGNSAGGNVVDQSRAGMAPMQRSPKPWEVLKSGFMDSPSGKMLSNIMPGQSNGMMQPQTPYGRPMPGSGPPMAGAGPAPRATKPWEAVSDHLMNSPSGKMISTLQGFLRKR